MPNHINKHKIRYSSKAKRKLCRKNFIRLSGMNDKKRNLILARNGIEKFISTIGKEEGISFQQVFYVLSFDAVFISSVPRGPMGHRGKMGHF